MPFLVNQKQHKMHKKSGKTRKRPPKQVWLNYNKRCQGAFLSCCFYATDSI
jgi:hypothetical protein